MTTTLRPRHDGWTADRQAGFIAALAAGSSIAAAAAAVGISRLAAAWGGAPRAATDADYNAAVDDGLDSRRARFDAAEAAYQGGAGVWFRRQLRDELRRARRRAAAARRVAAGKAAGNLSAGTHEKAGRSVMMRDLSPAAAAASPSKQASQSVNLCDLSPAAAAVRGKKPVAA